MRKVPPLPKPPPQYSQRDQEQLRAYLEREQARFYISGSHIELRPDCQIIMYSPNGTKYGITVSNAGALVVTSL